MRRGRLASKDGTPTKVLTKNGRTVQSQAVVVATNTPINDLLAIHTKQAPYLTYAISAEVPTGYIPKGLYWDTLESYHYIRVQPTADGREMIIVGGEDHKAGRSTIKRTAGIDSTVGQKSDFP